MKQQKKQQLLDKYATRPAGAAGASLWRQESKEYLWPAREPIWLLVKPVVSAGIAKAEIRKYEKCSIISFIIISLL